MFGIGPGELIIILVLALIIFGPGKLPEVGKAIGRSIREFKAASSAVEEGVRNVTAPVNEAVTAAAQQPATAPAQASVQAQSTAAPAPSAHGAPAAPTAQTVQGATTDTAAGNPPRQG